ncbi:MAG: hypothetical protein JSR58_04565 [Verrucomicrobia bacterium]|nr:hypothetical protein [Verrucomicrobiota bacterium]
MNSVAIYLAGSIKKAHEKSDDTYWTEVEMTEITHSLKPLQVTFLNPAFRTDDLSDQRSVFGRDMMQVFTSDVVFVDARDRRGLGVGAEMMWAKLNRIPVVTWAPRDSHYVKSRTTILGASVENWVHPFVESLSDRIVETVVEGALWIQEMLKNSLPIRGIEYVESAMQYYKKNQLEKDLPMKELLSSDNSLLKKLSSLTAKV